MQAEPVVIESLIPKAEDLGLAPITDEIIAKIEEVSKAPASHFLKRHIFYAHSGLAESIDHVASGKPLYLYFPITPTERLTHLRHIALLKFVKYLQTALNCYVFVHILDSKAFSREQSNAKWANVDKWTEETIRDVLSVGFNMEKTIVLRNTVAVALNYVMLCDMQRKVTLGKFFDSFFTDDSVNVATIDAVFQAAVCAIPEYVQKIFPSAETRCLMVLRPSQVKYFEFAAHTAGVLGLTAPAAVFGGFIPALQSGQKMPKLAQFALGANATADAKKPKGNAGRDYMTIYLKNTPKEVMTKLNKYAFSGGRDRLEDQRALGANLATDIPTYLYRVFEEDEERFAHAVAYYGPGELAEGNDARIPSGTMKKTVGECVGAVIKQLQDARAAVPKEAIEASKTIRSF